MNRIDQTFRALRDCGDAALIPFLTAGDPDLDTTRELMRVAVESGADLLELGVPFSDPTADGPVLQHSLEIGLRAGASLPRVMELVSDFRRASEVPVVLYGYFNPILRYEVKRFAADARQAGVDGVLVVDLPPEEVGELLPHLRAVDIHFIFLLAPTSGPNRVRKVLRHASGFIYYVSVTGVTGVRPMLAAAVRPVIEQLRRSTALPIGVGFGISTPEQAAAVAKFADAAVVGSAIMRIVDAHPGGAGVTAVGDFIRQLKDAMSAARGLAPQPQTASMPDGE
jgi:tryptophan synthase alpha chain